MLTINSITVLGHLICNLLLPGFIKSNHNDASLLPRLPLNHYPYFFESNPDLFDKLCKSTSKLDSSLQTICDYVDSVGFKCWGYETVLGHNCSGKIDPITECQGSSNGWTKTKTEQKETFFNQGDFGYIKERLSELTNYCQPKDSSSKEFKLLDQSSSLECTRYFRFCRAKSIMIDFKKLSTLKEPVRYRTDVLEDGLIGGWDCNKNEVAIKKENGHKSPLQSWYEELEHFTVFDDKPSCDAIITKPTYIMKLDATVNMYHHFCDFVNLYTTLLLNNSFSMDNNILIWDTYSYRSNFGIMWRAFTENPILDLNRFKGKKICFKDVVFPFLPRMVFGLYYNMPLVPGCQKSHLFQAFNQLALHRLNITQDFDEKSDPNVVRITLISRNTKYRRILNEEELLKSIMEKSDLLQVRKVEFTHQMPFEKQLKISHNSDMLIGMHGAGLTHCLFQPDWGVLFELYNCDDENCYKDLANLRGLKYITWSKNDKLFPQDAGNHPDLGAHQKFTNYRFDPEEFVRLVMIGVDYIRKERAKLFTQHQSTIIESKSPQAHQHSDF